MIRTVHRQRGATLIVALIMLVMLTLFALSAMNSSNTSLKIASNTQSRVEVAAATQQEIDKALSVDFTANPAAVAGSKPIDINRDGVTDYNVVVAVPTCISIVPIASSSLDITKPADAACFGSGTTMTSGLVTAGKAGGGTSANSLCSNTQWEISASTTDPLSGASISIHQGVAVRVTAGTSC